MNNTEEYLRQKSERRISLLSTECIASPPAHTKTISLHTFLIKVPIQNLTELQISLSIAFCGRFYLWKSLCWPPQSTHSISGDAISGSVETAAKTETNTHATDNLPKSVAYSATGFRYRAFAREFICRMHGMSTMIELIRVWPSEGRMVELEIRELHRK